MSLSLVQAAGLSAAIKAAEAESRWYWKNGTCRWQHANIHGIIYTGSDMQKDAGVEDSVEDLVNYWYERSEGKG